MPFDDSGDFGVHLFTRFDPAKILTAAVMITLFVVFIAFLRAKLCSQPKTTLTTLSQLNNNDNSMNDDSQVNANLIYAPPNPVRFDDVQLESRVHLVNPFHVYVSDVSPAERYPNDVSILSCTNRWYPVS